MSKNVFNTHVSNVHVWFSSVDTNVILFFSDYIRFVLMHTNTHTNSNHKKFI